MPKSAADVIAEKVEQLFCPDDGRTHQWAALQIIDALGAAGWCIVPMEPTEEMANKGEYCNSEWLNDNAPIGQRRYREPAIVVYRTMIAARPDQEG